MKHLSPAEIETIRVPEPKHDPFSLESLVAWLERQPGDGTYDYCDPFDCLLCRYFRAVGIPVFSIALNIYDLERRGKRHIFPMALKHISYGPGYNWTYGAALTRARAALASQKGNANG